MKVSVIAALRRMAGRATYLLPLAPQPGGETHFVRDYRRLVRRLRVEHPRDVAMSLAVGGDYDGVGARLAQIMIGQGLGEGDRLLDLGCGSGRLSTALGARLRVRYTGVDIVEALLAYARSRAPPDYRFIRSRSLTLPLEDGGFEMMAAFSLFTHLRHEETFAYLGEARRVLRPGGRLVFSFLEFGDEAHWRVFEETLDGRLRRGNGQANVFIERPVIALWAQRLGFAEPHFLSSEQGAVVGLGQSVAVLDRP